MANLTLADLRTLTRSLVGDPIIDPEGEKAQAFSVENVDLAIAWATRNYAEKTRCTLTMSALLDPTAGVVTLPEDCMLLLRVVREDGKVLLDTTKEIEDRINPGWTAGPSGVPRYWMWEDGLSLRLTPSDTTKAKVEYLQVPIPMVDETDEVDARIREFHQEHLRLAAAVWLLQLDGDQQNIQLSQAYLMEFNNLIGVPSPKSLYQALGRAAKAQAPVTLQDSTPA